MDYAHTLGGVSLVSLLRTPANAWPTQLLAALASALLIFSIGGALGGSIALEVSFAMSVVAAVVAFTPMHDASHRSVSKARFVNELVGRICATVLASPFLAFRYAHLEHHKHTNHHHLDPDYYSGKGPRVLLPLRWLTQDLHYYVIIAGAWKKLSRSVKVEVTLNLLLLLGVFSCFLAEGKGLTLLLAWILPVRLAIGLLSFSFDYLPHRPHATTSKENRFKATRVIEGPGLTLLFLYQNYHLIHHLYPGVPFYRYRKVFDSQQKQLLDKGMLVTRWFGPAVRTSHEVREP